MVEFLYNNWEMLMTLFNTLGLAILNSKIRR